MSACRVCGETAMTPLLAFGRQPICNRFLAHQEELEATFPLSLGQCPRCAMVQLLAGPPAEELRPRVSWIAYHEPEEHLDDLADRLLALPGIGRDSRICGLSAKDDSFLRRLRERGVRYAWRIELEDELRGGKAGAGVETVQAYITRKTGRALAMAHGPSDVIIARHILEHVHDLPAFLDGLRALAGPTAYLVLEVPDCERSLELCDYTMVWEEHTLYLTQATARAAAATLGVAFEQWVSYPYPLEPSLVGIGRFQADRAPHPGTAAAWQRERDRAQRYASRFREARERTKAMLEVFQRDHGRIALLGAGHLGAMFLNAFALQEDVAYVVDDHPNKRGLWMPGSRLPIVGSEALLEGDVKLCLLGVNPGREDGVVARYRAFLERGGEMASIFPGSHLWFEQLVGAKR